MKLIFTLLIILVFSPGCASRKKPEASGVLLAEKIFDLWKEFGKKIQESDTSDLVVQKATLPKSYSLAVYFIQPENKNQNWRWDRKDKDKIISSLEENKNTSRVFELINTSGNHSDPKQMRMMAAQQGADALLIIRGASDVDNDLNGKSLSYIAILPMLFVNGNNVKSTFVGQAILMDVRTPYVHLGVESEGKWKMERPLAFRQKNRATEKSKDKALTSLSEKLNLQLSRVN